MAKEKNGPAKEAEKKPAKPAEQSETSAEEIRCDVFSECVSPGGIIFMSIYLAVISVLLVYAIFQFWPPQEPAENAAGKVEFISWEIPMSVELRLLAVIVLTGALGGQIHTLRSFVSYVGNRKLRTSWLIQYFLTPFVAAGLALVFYLVIRAGFFPADIKIQEMNIYGFTGMAGLVGLFSNMAVNKLRCMAKELLGPVEKDEDPVRKEDDSGKKNSD